MQIFSFFALIAMIALMLASITVDAKKRGSIIILGGGHGGDGYGHGGGFNDMLMWGSALGAFGDGNIILGRR